MENAELLSPAGDFATALAAFEAGADAVYCGLGDFSARAFAVNFSLEDLRNLVRVAHARGRKVYVTFNTLVDEDALETAVARLADLADVRPDALIVQDLGVARLVRRHFPELALHASTQLVAHNLEGVLALKELGFTRVVLARELSLDEIASIAKRCGGLELECFIHGALCYSISGLCLFSAMEKGRSGNRGACAYCCRQGIEAKYPFSMKDLRLGEDVRKLVQAGVASLKIEGRMKSALYVASVTRFYRQILDKGEGPGIKGEGRRAKDEGPGIKGEGRRAKGEGPGIKGEGRRAKGEGPGVTVADLETVFSRRTTELYLNGAPLPTTNYQLPTSPSPIDPTSLGHLGTPIGTVKRVTRDREGRAWVRFHTARALERHDGLQFVDSGEGHASARPSSEKPFGFGITEMRTALSRSNVFEVAAGTDVEVLLPVDAASSPRQDGNQTFHRSPSPSPLTSLPRPGMTVCCSMSNAVKRMFPVPSFRPSDYPGETALDVTVTIEPTRIVATGRDRDIEVSVPGAFAPAKDPSRTYAAVEKAFSKLGGTDYRLGRLVVNDPDRLFAPASVLNDLRRDLVERVETARANARQARIDAALGDDGLAYAEDDAAGRRVHEGAVHVDAAPRRVSRVERSLRIRAGQTVPSGDWDEIVVAVDPQDASLVESDNFKSQMADQTLRLALPVYTKEPDFNRLRTLVKRLLRAGYDKWEASDLATVRMLRALGVTDLTADWTLYGFNSQALAALTELGVTRFVASPENNPKNLSYLAESGYAVAGLVQQSTPLFISLTKPAADDPGDLRVYGRDGLWITTKRTPRVFSVPKGMATRVDLSWDPSEEVRP